MALAFLLATSAAGGRLVARALTPASSPGRLRAIAWCVCAMGWALACAQGLALAAELFDRPLVRLPFVALISTCSWLLAFLADRRWGRRLPSWRFAASHAAFLPPRGWRRTLWWAALIPLVILHAALLLFACTQPPTGYDALYYHLPLVIRWLRAGRLYMIPYVHQLSLPGNGNLWQLLFAATDREPLLTLAFVPAGLLVALVVAAIAREIGATRTGAWIAAFFALASPMVALQMYSSYVDLFGSAFLLAALLWLLVLARADAPGRTGVAALCGLSAGIAVGSKSSLALWAVAIVVGFGAMLILGAARHPTARDKRAMLACAASFVLASTVGCGFWFFRAQIETGWLLHPIQLSFAGTTIGTGKPLEQYANPLPRPRWAYVAYPWFEWKKYSPHYSVDSGLGPQFAAFALVGMFLIAARLFARAVHRRQRRLVAGFCGFGIVLLFTVFRSYVRFALPLTLVGLAAGAPVVDLILRARRRAGVVLVASTIVLAVGMVGWAPFEAATRQWERRISDRESFYFLPPQIEQQPAGTVVLNLGEDTMNYPLLGARWQNRVIESMLARRLSLVSPLTQAQLDGYRIDLVYAEGDEPPPFDPEVRFSVLFDATSDGSRNFVTRRIRLYRVEHGAPAHVEEIFGPTRELQPPRL